MDELIRRPGALEMWVWRRLEHVAQLAPAEGQSFGLSFGEARRLLAYAGFSLYRDATALGLHPACALLARGAGRRAA